MYTSIRHYRCDARATAEIAHRADEGFADLVAREPGFVAYEVIDCGDGQLCTITVFSDRASAERSHDMAARFVHDQLSDIVIERSSAFTGEVLVNRAKSDMLELVHA